MHTLLSAHAKQSFKSEHSHAGDQHAPNSVAGRPPTCRSQEWGQSSDMGGTAADKPARQWTAPQWIRSPEPRILPDLQGSEWLDPPDLQNASRVRVQELCESGGWTSWAPVPNKPTVSADVKQHSEMGSELRSRVKVEVAVPNSTYGLYGRKATQLRTFELF